MSDFVFETLSLNSEFIKFMLAFFSKNPEYSDYAIYRASYFIPIVIAFIRNKSNFRLIFLGNLILVFIGLSILDFISKTHGIFIYTLCCFIFLLPIFIALIRNTYNLHSIFICNLIFGFTGISWLVILIWAIMEPENKPGKPVAKECKHCKEFIKPSATVCHHCHQSL